MTKTERSIRLLVLLITLLLAIFTYSQAHAQTPTGSIFAAQCGQIDSATLYQYARSTNSDGTLYTLRSYRVRNLNELATLQVAPGVWNGYESAAPFGGTYPRNDLGYWQYRLVTQSPCGEFEVWAWDNSDGTMLLFAFYNMQSNCDSNGNHCGRHNFLHYYVSLSEWQRVTRR
jgi:hypothetical protein